MANELYKDYLLISRAEYNAETGFWVPKINISWRAAKGGYHFHSLAGPSALFTAEQEAVAQGFLLARLWVDKRLLM
jgi:hypothetical protein